MTFGAQSGMWSNPVAIMVPTVVQARNTKIAIDPNLPPIADGNTRGVLSANLLVIDAATGALTKTLLTIVTFATKTDDEDEIYFVDHHTIALASAIVATQNFVELVYRPGVLGFQGEDPAAVAGTA